MIDKRRLVEQLKLFMDINNITKSQLAEKMGVCRTSVYRIFSEGKPIPIGMIEKISDVIEMPVEIYFKPYLHDFMYIKINEEDKKKIKQAAILNNSNITEYIMKAVSEKIENDKIKKEKYGKYAEV
jgi:transcriptional regulator with XRE-family HTH domain